MNFMKHRHSGLGFTLIELLVGIVVFSMMLTGLYQIYSSIVRTHETGQWILQTTTELRNGLSLLRGEISKDVKPYKITQRGIETPGGGPLPAEYYCLKSLTPNDGTLAKIVNFRTPKTVMEFYMTRPQKEGIPGDNDSPLEVMKGTLKVGGGVITYEREVASQDSTDPLRTSPMKQIICRSPASLTFRLEAPYNDLQVSVAKRNFIEITIQAAHPRYPKTRVTEKIMAPFEVVSDATL